MLTLLKFIALTTGGLSLLGSSLAWTAQGYMYESSGDVKAAIGTAQPQGVQKDQHLPDNTTVTVGPKSSATLKFEDGTVVLLNENTSFQIQKYSYDEKDASKISALFSLLKGGLRAVTGVISARNRDAFKVATPLATIGIRGTEFMAQLAPNNQVYMQVLAGVVNLSNAGGVGVFAAGQTASVTSRTAAPRSVPAAPPGTFGAMPAAKLPPAVPARVPAAPAAKTPAAKPAAKMSLEQVRTALKAPGDLATKVGALADQGVSASLIVAGVENVAGKDAVVSAIPVLLSKGADAAEVTTAAIAVGAAAIAVQSAAISAGADPTTVTTAAAAGQSEAAAAGPANVATPSAAPVPGGGGSGVPVSHN